MAARLVRYRDAHCCRHCSGRTVREITYWAGLKKHRTGWCMVAGRAVNDTDYCSRFRWAAQHRPPTPEKPKGLTVEQVAALATKPEELPQSEQTEEVRCD